MAEQKTSLAELKNLAMGFDRAEMRDVHIVKEPDDDNSLRGEVKGEREDYLSKSHMAVWNTDKNELACLAPKSYVVIQHRYATECLIDALSSLNIKAEARLKKSRHGVQIDFDFPESRFELTEVGEKFTTGIRVISDYSSVAGLQIAPRVTRLACSNGMVVTEVVRPRRIRFTEELTLTIEGLIDRIVKDIIASDSKLANMVSVCMEDSVEWQACRLLAKALFRKKKHVKEILSRIKLDDNGRVSRWEFYNAITEHCTRSERIRPNIDAWLQNKAQKVLATPFAKLTEELVRFDGKTDEQGD